MAVDIAPKRRNTIQILSTVHIKKIMALAPADDDGLFTHPFLHLGKRVPEVSMIQPCEFFIVHDGSRIDDRGSHIAFLSSNFYALYSTSARLRRKFLMLARFAPACALP